MTQLPAVPSPGAPDRRAPSPEMDRISALLAHRDADLASGIVRSFPPCPRFYAPRVIHLPRKWLNHASRDPMLIFVQGATLGVGVSTFLSDYAWAEQSKDRQGGHPVLYLDLLPSTGRPRCFLDALADALGGRITRSDLLLRDTRTICREILFAFRAFRVRLVIIDHAHHLTGVGREVLAHLMRRSDPSYSASSLGPNQQKAISYVLASPDAPGSVLGPLLGIQLTVSPIVFPTYGREDIASVIPQLDLGIPEVDLADLGHEEMVDSVLEATQGHVARMAPLFRAMIAARTHQPADTDLVRYAAMVTRGVTHLITQDRDHRTWDWEPVVRSWVSVPGTREQTPQPLPPAEKPPSVLKAQKRRKDQARAESYRRSVTSKRRGGSREPV